MVLSFILTVTCDITYWVIKNVYHKLFGPKLTSNQLLMLEMGKLTNKIEELEKKFK